MSPKLTVLYAAALLLLHAIPCLCSTMQVVIYTGLDVDDDRYSMESFTTQMCYTFSSCLDGSNVGAEWESIDGLAIVFYEKEQCQGTKLISHTLPNGKQMFTFDKGAKSFMVWEQGMYPTNGIEYKCQERATLNLTSNSSESAGVILLP